MLLTLGLKCCNLESNHLVLHDDILRFVYFDNHNNIGVLKFYKRPFYSTKCTFVHLSIRKRSTIQQMVHLSNVGLLWKGHFMTILWPFYDQRIQTTRSHTSRCHHCQYCHYCTVDFVLFHNFTCYTSSRLSRVHVNSTNLLDITCILVATGVILGRLDCISCWFIQCPGRFFSIIGRDLVFPSPTGDM